MTATIPRSLPDRYQEGWHEPFDTHIAPALRPGATILDVGSGRQPAIERDQRPLGCRYVGLDISEAELERAPAGSYDERWVSDVTRRIPQLEGRFDLIISWQVLEHVKPLDAAIENLRTYLRPGGRLVAQFSGTFSLFGMINQVVPQRLGCWAMRRLLGRSPDTVFPAYYDHCWDGALREMLTSWQSFEIIPRYRGAGYFDFSRPLQRLYLRYEDRAWRRKQRNLATHYLIDSVR